MSLVYGRMCIFSGKVSGSCFVAIRSVFILRRSDLARIHHRKMLVIAFEFLGASGIGANVVAIPIKLCMKSQIAGVYLKSFPETARQSPRELSCRLLNSLTTFLCDTFVLEGNIPESALLMSTGDGLSEGNPQVSLVEILKNFRFHRTH